MKRPAARCCLVLLLAASGVGCGLFRGPQDPMAADIAEAKATRRGEKPSRGVFKTLVHTVTSTPTFVVNSLTGRQITNAARRMEDAVSPDERRVGIAKLSSTKTGRRRPYTERYAQIAADDSDWLVRATAVRALNRARDKDATGVFVRGLDDTSEQVRLESAKALANTWDGSAAVRLRALLSDRAQSKDLRIAAADALRQDDVSETRDLLVRLLTENDFAIAWTARRSLREMTGQDERFDQAAWQQVIAGRS